MNKPARRWLDAIGISAIACALLTFGTGCGAIKAAANPKVAWALKDPAPMSVVVRRAEVAEKTAQEVDRLLTTTPMSEDSDWPGKVAPEAQAVAKDMEALKTHDLYQGGSRVVAAEVWAKELAHVAPKEAAVPAPAPEPAAPAAKLADDKADKKTSSNKKDGKKKAKKRAEEVAEAPPPPPAPVAPQYESVLIAIDPELGAGFGRVMAKKKAIGESKGRIKVLEAANDQKGISDADKAANEKTIGELENHVDALDREATNLTKAFIPKVKASAQKAPPAVRERFGVMVVNLRQAVDDAGIANGAAAVRYPMAVTTLLDSAKQMAKVYVADVVEEKTGKRPNTSTLTPGVTMENGDIAVTLNGLTLDDMGKISIADVTKEVATRTANWGKRALGLLGTVAATSEVLELENDLLGAIIEGFSAAGWQAPKATTIGEPTSEPSSGGNGGLGVPSVPSVRGLGLPRS